MNHETYERHERDGSILYKEEAYAIQEAVFEVYREKGFGFVEPDPKVFIKRIVI